MDDNDIVVDDDDDDDDDDADIFLLFSLSLAALSCISSL